MIHYIGVLKNGLSIWVSPVRLSQAQEGEESCKQSLVDSYADFANSLLTYSILDKNDPASCDLISAVLYWYP